LHHKAFINIFVEFLILHDFDHSITNQFFDPIAQPFSCHF